ncbi:MAG TPA: DUF4956 domain-containing protein [Gemmatimonadales bacterium]|nr:DUF4956 domain-containing protein [Gemmatimonadales bacterium]
MARPAPRTFVERLSEMPLAKVTAYYVILIAGSALLVRLVPSFGAFFSTERMEDLARGAGFGGGSPFDAPVPVLPGPVSPAFSAALAMFGATLLMIPVAWIYTMTRQKKGFRQSIVQTLIILPGVVAGVVILVKNSLALAFGLAGIVAAINFRNTLRDTKDAVYIFVAMVVGLASGVQAMPIALAVSVFFNVVIVALAWTDFGRMPAALEGARARARLERARALANANRTGMFVSVMEREVLKSLSPEQLDALADRARRIRARSHDDLGDPNGKPLDTVLRIYAAQPEAVRPGMEAILTVQVKAWRFGRPVQAPDGMPGLEYNVRLRKKVPADLLLAQLRERGRPQGVRAEIA